ncbi:MAG: hypothetical protein EOM68_21485 [Spirochaetia bacterium]|nr:hypothetical protein [Spirochaetia bacterium]
MYWDYAPVTLDEILSQTVRASEPKYETLELTIDSDLYEQAGEVFKRYGLTHEEAIQLFFKETVRLGRIPFDYTPEDLAEAKRLCGEADENGE